MSEYIDYQAYKKHLLLTLSIDFIREDGIYQGVGISDVAGRTGRRKCLNRMAINKQSLKFEHVPKRTMRVLSFPGPVLSSENRSVQGDLMHSCTQSLCL